MKHIHTWGPANPKNVPFGGITRCRMRVAVEQLAAAGDVVDCPRCCAAWTAKINRALQLKNDTSGSDNADSYALAWQQTIRTFTLDPTHPSETKGYIS